jgi:predicted deacetylase
MLVVSVHDISPSALPEVRWILERLDALDVRPRVLLVVPCQAGREDVRRSLELVQLLRAEVEAGSEIAMHGFTHRADGPLRGGLLTRLRARLAAGGTAEFASLELAEMQRRLGEGRAMLQEIGLQPAGFCAPAWLSPPELPPLLAAEGMRYLTTFTSVIDLQRGVRDFVPAAGYLGAPRTAEALTRLGSLLAGIPAARSPHRRVFLHPQGASTSADCARVLRRIGQLRSERTATTFSGLLDA